MCLSLNRWVFTPHYFWSGSPSDHMGLHHVYHSWLTRFERSLSGFGCWNLAQWSILITTKTETCFTPETLTNQTYKINLSYFEKVKEKQIELDPIYSRIRRWWYVRGNSWAICSFFALRHFEIEICKISDTDRDWNSSWRWALLIQI